MCLCESLLDLFSINMSKLIWENVSIERKKKVFFLFSDENKIKSAGVRKRRFFFCLPKGIFNKWPHLPHLIYKNSQRSRMGRITFLQRKKDFLILPFLSILQVDSFLNVLLYVSSSFFFIPQMAGILKLLEFSLFFHPLSKQ